MTRPYSEDLRERVVRVVESGTSRNAAAKQFYVSVSFVVKLMQRWKQRGTIKADKYGGWKKSKLAAHADRIRALVKENCDITIDELCVLLAAEGIEAKRSTLGDFLLAQGLIPRISSHKVAGVREALEAVGATPLYPPPDSPDLNPIEPVFAKLEAILRKVGARTIDDLRRAIGNAIDQFSPSECGNYLANAGYSV